ncbi:hypothetical protein ACFWVC_14800 [Streptomyces sp. NPDC058691]|uniref:hypothetical protein n=1 Tax=Streptomyces sp. NPDC058691 TaxID=3346601 RepID=UPI00365FB988
MVTVVTVVAPAVVTVTPVAAPTVAVVVATVVRDVSCRLGRHLSSGAGSRGTTKQNGGRDTQRGGKSGSPHCGLLSRRRLRDRLGLDTSILPGDMPFSVGIASKPT